MRIASTPLILLLFVSAALSAVATTTTTTTKPKSVAIFGGGIGGLTVAHELAGNERKKPSPYINKGEEEEEGGLID